MFNFFKKSVVSELKGVARGLIVTCLYALDQRR